MQKILAQFAAVFVATSLLSAPANSAQFEKSGMVFTTIAGPIHNLVLYAPKPTYPPVALQQRLSGYGVYKLDLDSGTPYDVRVIRSTGYAILDDAAVAALRTWRFVPHRTPWVTIPIEFRVTKSRHASQTKGD